jgi:hypothetical protein
MNKNIKERTFGQAGKVVGITNLECFKILSQNIY